MAAITCSCGQTIIDMPGLFAIVQRDACPDCDPDGYPLRWSCPFPPRSISDEIGQLRRRAGLLEAALTACLRDMARWAADEDGIPEEAWSNYQHARALVGMVGYEARPAG